MVVEILIWAILIGALTLLVGSLVGIILVAVHDHVLDWNISRLRRKFERLNK